MPAPKIQFPLSGYADVTALTEKVAADIEQAREWKTGSVKYDGPRPGTEKGFRH